MLAKKTFKENNDGLHLLSLIAILIESLIKENSKDKRAKAVNEGDYQIPISITFSVIVPR